MQYHALNEHSSSNMMYEKKTFILSEQKKNLEAKKKARKKTFEKNKTTLEWYLFYEEKNKSRKVVCIHIFPRDRQTEKERKREKESDGNLNTFFCE